MKYCLRCAKIIADNSMFKDREICNECNLPFEEDGMTGEMFEALSENGKQEYADKLFKTIKSSNLFDSALFYNNIKLYGEKILYHCWWYDRYEKLGGKFCARYETDEQRKERLDREYGKDSPAYQKALLDQYIQADRERKANNSNNNNNVPRCPICQSANLSRISSLKKATKIGLFGIFGAGDIGKTWKCNNCGSRF